jgi:hypothetical protein
MSDAMRNDPGRDKPDVPTWFVGCVGWVVLIVGGFWYWSYWTGEIEKKNEEAVQKKFQRPPESSNWQNWQTPDWLKEQDRRMEAVGRVADELQRSNNLHK